MSTTSMLKANGLQTFQNFLSSVPEGSLFEAENVVIDRDGIIEPRRGLKIHADLPDIPKQLLTYKNTTLAHYRDALAYYNGTQYIPYQKRVDFIEADVNVGNSTIVILLHGLSENDPVIFLDRSSEGSILPSPLISGITYYASTVTQNSFKVSATPGGIAITLSDDGTGENTAIYDYVVQAPDNELRVQGVEFNGNFYVTSTTGVKKILGLNPYYIQDSGVPRAYGIQAVLNTSDTLGFLESQQEVTYRMTWATTDINSNLVEGSASPPTTIYNPSSDSRNVDLTFAIPANLTTDYIYRIYRTAQTDAGNSGDEEKLVYEGNISTIDISAGTILITDNQPEALQDSGLPLYSNQISGEGASQTNDRPPICKDIAIYKNTIFFANTSTNYSLNSNILGQDGLGHLPAGSITTISYSLGFTTFTYNPGHGLLVDQDVVLVGSGNGMDGTYSAIILSPTQFKIAADFSIGIFGEAYVSTFTSYIDIIKEALTPITNRYYFVGRPATGSFQVNVNTGINGKYFEISSADDITEYYVWLNNINSPANDPGPFSGKVGLMVDYDEGTDTIDDIAEKIKIALNNTGDFICIIDTLTLDTIDITTANSGAPTISGGGAKWTNGNFGADLTYVPGLNGFGENYANNYVRISSLPSVSLRIEDTTKSLVNVINANIEDFVLAYYSSLPAELPGSFVLESKEFDGIPFSLKANNSATGSMFNSNITQKVTATNETNPNRIYFSKPGQGEAVPTLNNIDVGPKDKEILRILGLRDSLFILKEEGVYRLTGDDITTFNVTLFDNSVNLIAPDSAAILNNQIYALTSQGVTTISEGGIGVISRPIENIFSRVSSPNYTHFRKATVGCGYEADRCYLLFTIDKSSDTYATKGYRYNTFTRCWTRWDVATTSAAVELSQNKLYLGAADIAGIQVERKTITARDYVDREYQKDLVNYLNGYIFNTIDKTSVGDMYEQTQYLTPSVYNWLIRKAKNDPLLQLDQNYPEIESQSTDLTITLKNLALTLDTLDTPVIISENNIASNSNVFSNTNLLSDGVAVLATNTVNNYIINRWYFTINTTPTTLQLTTVPGSIADILTGFVGSVVINGSLNYYFTESLDFEQLQWNFNYNVRKLNTSPNVFFTDYIESEGTVNVGSLVKSIAKFQKLITFVDDIRLFKGSITHYKGIPSSVTWAPNALGDPSLLKHIRSGTFLLENNSLWLAPSFRATVSYASDLSGSFDEIQLGLSQDQQWGNVAWNEFTWGGEGTSVPIRVLIPRKKQRCRYIKARFQHNTAMNKYSILGISYTFEMGSDRAYRG